MARHTSRAIVMHDTALLLMERWRDDLHYYSVPGGGIEPGETAEQAVVREIMEETGCQVRVTRLLYQLQTAEGNQHSFFLCDYLSGTPHLQADAPEAQRVDSNNRFKPGWLPLDQVASSDFMVWQPIRDQLLHDLTAGFAKTVVKLKTDMVR